MVYDYHWNNNIILKSCDIKQECKFNCSVKYCRLNGICMPRDVIYKIYNIKIKNIKIIMLILIK